jgi:hypothetical protein
MPEYQIIAIIASADMAEPSDFSLPLCEESDNATDYFKRMLRYPIRP